MLYCGLDLHAKGSFLYVIDQRGHWSFNFVDITAAVIEANELYPTIWGFVS